MCDASKDLATEAEIIEGWKRVCEDYEPRPLTTLERHQMEQAELAERQAAETPFKLGQVPYLKEPHG